MNVVVLSGRLCKETDLKYTGSGTAIANNTLAVEDGFGENKQTYFVNLVFFQKTAESVANHSFKGQKVSITGKLVIRSYEKDGKKNFITEVHANQIEYQEWKQKDGADHAKTVFKDALPVTLSDDDLPF
jgi:single-strand DNA-binding protein